jgi:hypothetical protein
MTIIRAMQLIATYVVPLLLVAFTTVASFLALHVFLFAAGLLPVNGSMFVVALLLVALLCAVLWHNKPQLVKHAYPSPLGSAAICWVLAGFFHWKFSTGWNASWADTYPDNIFSVFFAVGFFAGGVTALFRDKLPGPNAKGADNFTVPFWLSIAASSLLAYDLLSNGTRSTIWKSSPHMTVMLLLGIGPILLLHLYRRWTAPKAAASAHASPPIASERDGLPRLSWSQVVGTGKSQADAADLTEWRVMLFVMAIGVAAGFMFSRWEGAIIGGMVGVWLAGMAPRSAQGPDLRLPIEGYSGSAPRTWLGAAHATPTH